MPPQCISDFTWELSAWERAALKALKKSNNQVKQSSIGPNTKIDTKENDLKVPEAEWWWTAHNQLLQHVFFWVFLAFRLWRQMPSDTEHTGDAAICTDGHQRCKETCFMAAVVLLCNAKIKSETVGLTCLEPESSQSAASFIN